MNRFHKIYLLLILPFFYMDLAVRLVTENSGFYPSWMPAPNLFTLIYIGLFIGIMSCFGSIGRRVLYWILFLLSFAFFTVNLIYYNLTGLYFSFNLLQMADEGSSYILGVVKGTPIYTWAMLAGALFLGIVCEIITSIIAGRNRRGKDDYFIHRSDIGKGGYKRATYTAENRIRRTKQRKFAWKRFLLVAVLFVVLHLLVPFSMGKANSTLVWKSFRNARNVYETFSDTNKCMRVSGMYEYGIRDFYVTFLKPEEKMTSEEASFLANEVSDTAASYENTYTGKFSGKNVIFLQLEGMDSWLLNKEDTPNLYKLKKESINFTKHYSIYTGGGSTFNSEFAVNVGFTTPSSYTANVYTYNNHTFPQTMAKMFKNEGYSVNAFHMNSKEFYSRGINYQSWGYDAYNSLEDQEDYSDESYELDRALIENQDFYHKMFQQSGKFVDYIITYTPHTPFTTEKGVGKQLAELNYGSDIPSMDEEAVVRMEVAETDKMVGELIQALKDNDLYDNTIIVAYADHYLYTINDKTVLDQYKNTSDNRINQTPFFIWSADSDYEKVTKVNMQYDILPTVLNLMGISYNPTYYLGADILSFGAHDLAVFSDGSWYDGEVYAEGSTVTWKSKNAEESEAEINAKAEEAADLLKKNDLILKYDYFKNIEK